MKELDLKILSKFKGLMEDRPNYITTGFNPSLNYSLNPQEKYISYSITLQYCDPNIKNKLDIEPEDNRCSGTTIWCNSDSSTMHYKKMFTLQTPSGGKYYVKFKSESEFDDYVDKFEMFMTDALMAELD